MLAVVILESREGRTAMIGMNNISVQMTTIFSLAYLPYIFPRRTSLSSLSFLSLVLLFFDRGRMLFPNTSNKQDLIAMRMLHEIGRARALVDVKSTSTLQDLRIAEPAARSRR